MGPCALEETGEPGERVDFERHEVLSVVETEDDGADSSVAEVFSPGCIYHGEVIKRAQVAAYRRRKDVDRNRD